jgi:hypothetical protein
MEQIISGISDKLKEKVSKKQFLKESGILILGVLIVPSLLTKILKKDRLRMDGDKIYLDDELFIERREE